MAIGLGAALLGSAIIGGATSAIGASKAAGAAKSAAAQNNATQLEIYNSNKDILSPYVSRGNAAGANVNALLGLSNDNGAAQNAFQQYLGSDGYNFRVGEGMRALNTGLASRGLIQSGAAIKEATKLGQSYGSDEFGRYLGYLGNQQGVGLSAGSALAGVGQNYANAVSANNNSAASAVGNSALTTASNINSILNNGVNALALQRGLSSSYGAGGGF